VMLNRGSIGGFHKWTRITTPINDLERRAHNFRVTERAAATSLWHCCRSPIYSTH
jgi:hypothetical protein